MAHDDPIEQSNARMAINAHTSGWHLWRVFISRRSISGKLVSGQVWRRRHGAKWAYKKFVEYADRDIQDRVRGTKRQSDTAFTCCGSPAPRSSSSPGAPPLT